MNSNIKNSLNVCGIPNEDLMDLYKGSSVLVTEFYLKNFAELIVKESINCIMSSTDRYRKEYFANLLKEHWGIK